VDEVPVVLWVIWLETDGRIPVEVFNSLQDLVSLIISYTENGSVLVHDRV
jgi:hypothetical protein